MKSNAAFGLFFLLTALSFSSLSSTAAGSPDWCRGNACDFVQVLSNGDCHIVTNTSPSRAMIVQWGVYDVSALLSEPSARHSQHVPLQQLQHRPYPVNRRRYLLNRRHNGHLRKPRLETLW
jgi:hypothetical protein